jgi:threonine dehydratase
MNLARYPAAPSLDYAAAASDVRDLALVTPLLEAPALSERMGRQVLLKLECLQVTGSFKVRGAAARLSSLTPPERKRGVVACSSGNHGRAVSYVSDRLGIPATVYVPEWVDPVKLAGIRAHGAEAKLIGATFDESEAAAVEDAHATGRTYVSAYDDPWVIAGQGSIGLEVLSALPTAPAAMVVPLSGGGLAGGIAGAMRERLGAEGPEIVAVSAENAAVMLASVKAGAPVDLPEEDTLANALAGGIGPENRYSFAMIRDLVDTHVTVTEREIASAMLFSFNDLRIVTEGGGAVGLAAMLADRWRPPATRDGPIVIVVSGGNVDLSKLSALRT